MIPKNMYSDAIYRWNVVVGCKFDCVYCKPSFQRQMKRQKPTIDKNGKKRGCQKCYDYIPHVHEDRLTDDYCKKYFPKKIEEDQFIWIGSSGDISFIEDKYMERIFEIINQYSQLTFFFQTKSPIWFQKWDFPKNVVLGITLESNIHYPLISKAPKPWKRAADFFFVNYPRKRITIEPILEFDYNKLFTWIRDIKPEIVYIGYNTKNCKLPEPPLEKVQMFISSLRRITKVKEKLMRRAWNEK